MLPLQDTVTIPTVRHTVQVSDRSSVKCCEVPSVSHRVSWTNLVHCSEVLRESRKVPWISLVSQALFVSEVLLTIFVNFTVVLMLVVITWTQVAYIVLCAPCIRVYEVPWIHSWYCTIAHPLVLIYGSCPECSKLCSVTYTLLHSMGKSMCTVFYFLLDFICLVLTCNLQIQSALKCLLYLRIRVS